MFYLILSQSFLSLLSDNTINLSGNTLSVFYDPPHLIKGIRNNWLTKDMVFQGKTAKWQDIVDVYNADSKHGKILHKLTDQHVIREKIKKMKVIINNFQFSNL